MRYKLIILLVLLSPLATIKFGRIGYDISVGRCAEGDSWVFRPSYFSHDPEYGSRTAQYAQERVTYAREDPTYLESAYRHNQTIMRDGDGSADRLHIVQTWGNGAQIRPYGEWLFPYRAGATPYGPWGNPQGPWTLPFQSWQNPFALLNHIPGGHGGGPIMISPYIGNQGGTPSYGAGYGNGSSGSEMDSESVNGNGTGEY